jgi:hypothetical protein
VVVVEVLVLWLVEVELVDVLWLTEVLDVEVDWEVELVEVDWEVVVLVEVVVSSSDVTSTSTLKGWVLIGVIPLLRNILTSNACSLVQVQPPEGTVRVT